MRITQRTIVDNNVRGMNANLAALAKLQDQITSGKALTRPSDSPSGTSTAMRTRGDLSMNDQYKANISTATTVLTAADGALGAMGDLVRRVRDLTVQGANTGGNSAEANEALAVEVAGIREGLLALANRTVNGRPVFGGATSGTTAYDTGGAFQGRTGVPQQIRVSDSETVRTDMDGVTAFGVQTGIEPDLFALVAGIAGDLRTDPTALSARLVQLDTAAQRLTQARTTVGVRTNRVEQVAAVNSTVELSLRGQLSDVEDIDQAKTYLELQIRQNTYEAALSGASRTIQTSLVDYLR